MKSGRLVLGEMVLLAGMLLATPALAGDLNPPGAPAPTMKTLDQIPPTWDQILSVDQRFKLVMGGAAVLDKETGLVWEKSLDIGAQTSWGGAQGYCFEKTVGGRRGWRLPSSEELASMVDPASPDPMLLADGHPFLNVQGNFYWSATADAVNTDWAWSLYVGYPTNGPKISAYFVWCVRGGGGVNTR